MSPRIRPAVFALLAAATSASAQDAPPVNAAEVLAVLRQLRDAQVSQEKTAKQTAIQQAQAGAASAAKAVEMWEEAVRLTQFQGVAKENAAFREWRDREGQGLKGREAQAAAQMHFKWLVLTLQRSNGASVKDLLPQVIAYAKEATVLETAIEALGETIKKEREAASGAPRRSNARENLADSQAVKRMADQIFRKPLAGSPVVQIMKATEFVSPDKWESNPGNVDGIFQKIVLPELRLQRDPRALEYWDLRLKHEAEAASARRADFEITKFNTVRRPELLWSRANEMAEIGLKNRAIGEMLTIIKANPAHPSAGTWISELEKLIAPPAAAPAP